jgi:hypothetical protein
LDYSQGIYILGVNPGDHCGYSVAGAGDVNGDGYDDIIIVYSSNIINSIFHYFEISS